MKIILNLAKISMRKSSSSIRKNFSPQTISNWGKSMIVEYSWTMFLDACISTQKDYCFWIWKSTMLKRIKISTMLFRWLRSLLKAKMIPNTLNSWIDGTRYRKIPAKWRTSGSVNQERTQTEGMESLLLAAWKKLNSK